MRKLWTGFLGDESGAVTADWVMLTGVVVGITLSLGVALGFGSDSVFAQITEFVTAALEDYAQH